MNYNFNTEYAKKYGLLESILIAHFTYEINVLSSNIKPDENQRYWININLKQLQKQFYFSTQIQLEKALGRLIDKKCIVYKNTNKELVTFSSGIMQTLQEQHEILYVPDNKELFDVEELPELPFKDKINYQMYIDTWNNILKDKASAVQSCSAKRKQMIKARFNEGINEIKFQTICTLLNTLNYMFEPKIGEHKNWKPTFDWVISNSKDCCTKIYEGVYHSSAMDKAEYENIMANKANKSIMNNLPSFTDETRPDGYDDKELGRWSKSRGKWIR